MVKWLVIILVVVVTFITVLLGLGYLLKEHEVATIQLKHQLDQERLQQQQKEKRRKEKFKNNIETSLITIVSNSDSLSNTPLISRKKKILIDNLTCSSKKQCVLVNIQFADLSCDFAINTIGASLLAKASEDASVVGKCPEYPKSSQLSCQSNLCTFGGINN